MNRLEDFLPPSDGSDQVSTLVISVRGSIPDMIGNLDRIRSQIMAGSVAGIMRHGVRDRAIGWWEVGCTPLPQAQQSAPLSCPDPRE